MGFFRRKKQQQPAVQILYPNIPSANPLPVAPPPSAPVVTPTHAAEVAPVHSQLQPAVIAPPAPVEASNDTQPAMVAVHPTGFKGKGKVRHYPAPVAGWQLGGDGNAWSYATRLSTMTNPETGKPYVDPNIVGSFALGLTPQAWHPDYNDWAAWLDLRLHEDDWLPEDLWRSRYSPEAQQHNAAEWDAVYRRMQEQAKQAPVNPTSTPQAGDVDVPIQD